jgi:hypothetical protein
LISNIRYYDDSQLSSNDITDSMSSSITATLASPRVTNNNSSTPLFNNNDSYQSNHSHQNGIDFIELLNDIKVSILEIYN